MERASKSKGKGAMNQRVISKKFANSKLEASESENEMFFNFDDGPVEPLVLKWSSVVFDNLFIVSLTKQVFY